jgi:cell division protease FtsH
MKGYKDLAWALKDTLLERYVLSKDEVFALLEELTDQQDQRQAA